MKTPGSKFRPESKEDLLKILKKKVPKEEADFQVGQIHRWEVSRATNRSSFLILGLGSLQEETNLVGFPMNNEDLIAMAQGILYALDQEQQQSLEILKRIEQRLVCLFPYQNH